MGISSNDIAQRLLSVPGMKSLVHYYLEDVPAEEAHGKSWQKIAVSAAYDDHHASISNVFHRHVDTDTLYRADGVDWLLLKHLVVAFSLYELGSMAYSYKWSIALLGVGFVAARQFRWVASRYQESHAKGRTLTELATREMQAFGNALVNASSAPLKLCGYGLGAFGTSLYGVYNPREARVYLSRIEERFYPRAPHEEGSEEESTLGVMPEQQQSVRQWLGAVLRGDVLISDMFKLGPVVIASAEERERLQHRKFSVGGSDGERASSRGSTPLSPPDGSGGAGSEDRLTPVLE
ncbi:MAG: hypothetical protein KR126chlam1_00395 [Chlamydiae bacterium]|nr:hypothetical protein [Chlamydiota bacterium]